VAAAPISQDVSLPEDAPSVEDAPSIADASLFVEPAGDTLGLFVVFILFSHCLFCCSFHFFSFSD
jgi:hypothetical protein